MRCVTRPRVGGSTSPWLARAIVSSSPFGTPVQASRLRSAHGCSTGSTAARTSMASASEGAAWAWRSSNASASPTAPKPQRSTSAAPVPALPDFSGLVEKYGPAVVNISVVQTRKTAGHGQSPDDQDLPPLLRNLPFQFQFPQPQDRGPVRGVGSGFIVSADGVILTNAHVVDDADEVSVKLTDKREFTAKVLGVDKTTDIAVLKIQAAGLPYVKVGDPRTTKVGEWVVAIGQPF